MGLCLLVVVACGITFVLAEGVQATSETTQVGETSEQIELPDQSKALGRMMIQVVVYTLLVIGLIVLFVRFLGKRQQKLGYHQLFQHMGGTSLGPNKSLQLIKVGDKIYLLGVSEQITLIKEIDDPAEIERIEADREKQQVFLQTPVLERWKYSLDQWRNQKEDSHFHSLLKRSLQNQQVMREQYQRHLHQGHSADVSGRGKKEG
ncbi:flagellar protein FliO/FliZ [Caldalkalibacillus uzonensis]|uniref:Flagellar protein FliO/FliZ n=1 Tax=Caldalkalibacillus uzonensis TaxID=353224 RepID=A0ABU0CP52_9BACI|nr:flagellar protein FliO/FliZ [Caldalkalibacillus uzonensis]